MTSTELAVQDRTKVSRLDDSLFSKDLAPHYMQLATKLASSALVPKSFQGKPQDLFICWEMGYQVGLSPAQAMQCIAVINGKPAMWGDEMLALCMVHKDFEDISEERFFSDDGVMIGYTCTVKRKGRTPTVNTFTLDMAKKAGLLGKQGPWTTATERMLKLRARGYSLRDAFPDALKGIKSREEIEDFIDAEFSEVKITRSELLKREINAATNTEISHMAEPVDDRSYSEAANQSTQPANMDKAGEREVGVCIDSPTLSPITQAQTLEIITLMEETGFPEVNQINAWKYYEVDGLHELTEKSAHHFITQLKKR